MQPIYKQHPSPLPAAPPPLRPHPPLGQEVQLRGQEARRAELTSLCLRHCDAKSRRGRRSVRRAAPLCLQRVVLVRVQGQHVGDVRGEDLPRPWHRGT